MKEEVICDGEVKKCDEAFLKFVTGGVLDKVVKLVGGGSVINGAYPV